MDKNPILFSILVGFLMTLVTSLFANTYVVGEFPDISFVSIPLLGMNYWGLPMPWIKQVVYPGVVKEII